MTQCAIMLRLSVRLYPNPQAATSGGAGSGENNHHNCSKITLCLGQRGGGDEGKNIYIYSFEAAVRPESGWEKKIRNKRNDESKKRLKSRAGGVVAMEVRWFTSKKTVAWSFYLALLYIWRWSFYFYCTAKAKSVTNFTLRNANYIIICIIIPTLGFPSCSRWSNHR